MLVVGNGPSLNDTPLNQLRHLPAIGMNKIDLLYPKTDWRPSLVVCVNNLVASQNRSIYAASTIPIFLAWKCRWFTRTSSSSIHYFLNKPTLSFSTDVREGIASLSPTVTYVALQFAYYLGANPAVLVGVDHHFEREGTGIEKRSGIDRDHFDPNYFVEGQYWGFPDLAGSEIAYTLAKRAFEADGREVVDATVNGNLDVFRKVNIGRFTEG